MNKNLHRNIFYIALALFAVLVIWLIFRINIEPTTFDTDEADHANAGIELFSAMLTGNIRIIYDAIVRQSFYPPLHSFFISISYLILGPTIQSSRFPSIIVFAAYVLVIAFLTQQFLRKKVLPIYAGSGIAMLLAFTSPITIKNSVICMLEPTGLLTTSVSLFAVHKYGGRKDIKAMFLIAFSIILVFLSKYSFGIIVLPAILSSLFFEYNPDSGVRLNYKKPFEVCFFTVLLFCIWLFLTDYLSVWHFFVGHPSYAPILSAENLLYDVRSWLNVYCVNKLISLFVLGFAVISVYFFISEPLIRACLFLVFWALFILGLSTTNEERHFLVAAPGLWILAGVGYAKLHSLLVDRKIILNYTQLFFCGAFLAGIYNHTASLEDDIDKGFEGEDTYYDLQRFIVDNISKDSPILVNGNTDNFSIESIRWMVASIFRVPYTHVKVDSYPFREDKNKTARKRKRNLERPWEVLGFPKKPLINVLETGYYKYAVQIKNLNPKKKQRFRKEAKEFEEILAGLQITTKVAVDIKVDIAVVK